MFIFICRIENCARLILNLKFIESYRGEDMREAIHCKLQDSKLINDAWESISRMLPNRKLADVIKKQILQKWVDNRAKAFVNAYVLLVKRTLSKKAADAKSKVELSKQGAQSMRKTLT